MEIKKKFVINAAFYAVILAIVILGYRYILPILMPFIIGFCIASVVQIPLKWLKLEKRRHKRWAAVLVCVLFYAIVASLLVVVGAKLVNEIGGFIKAMPDLFQNQMYPYFVRLSKEVREILTPIDSDLAEGVVDLGKAIIENLGQLIKDVSTTAVKWVASSAVSIPGFIVQVIITVVSSFYIAVDYRKLLAFFTTLIPKGKRGVALQTLGYIRQAVAVYIKSYAILFTMTFIELTIGLMLLKVSYAVPIALAIAVFDLMPVLGTGGILLPWALILVIMGDFPMAIGVVLLYLVITVVRQTVEPRLVGDQIGLHPLATLVAMMLGLKLVGLLGMLLFPVGLVVILNLRKNMGETEKSE